MTHTEALKMALEALEGVLDDAPKVLDASIAGGLYEVVQCRDAITAIKEALAQPEQEPVAWDNCRSEKQCRSWCGNSTCVSHWSYTTPPQRKPLTDEEALDMARTFGAQPWPPGSCVAFARAVEAAHGIKE